MSAPIAAFFDLDMTLISKSSAFAFGKPFLKAGLVSWRDVAWLAKEQAIFLLHGADDSMIERQRQTMSRIIKGWDAAKMNRLITDAIPDLILPYVFPEGAALLDKHRAAGHTLIILSTSGDPMVRPIAEALGVETARGATVEVVDGVLTGEVEVGKAGEVKVHHALELAEERGFDLSEAYFYTDSISDLPLLKLVGHPVAVNPDKQLLKEAESRNWEILRFRKTRC